MFAALARSLPDSSFARRPATLRENVADVQNSFRLFILFSPLLRFTFGLCHTCTRSVSLSMFGDRWFRVGSAHLQLYYMYVHAEFEPRASIAPAESREGFTRESASRVRLKRGAAACSRAHPCQLDVRSASRGRTKPRRHGRGVTPRCAVAPMLRRRASSIAMLREPIQDL